MLSRGVEKEIIGVQLVVPKEFIDRAVKLIASRPNREIDDGSSRPAELGGKIVRLDPEFLRRIEGLLTYLIPHYIREGKSYLTIAFGCTGGKHRSVMLAEAVKKSLGTRGFAAKVVHRDIDK